MTVNCEFNLQIRCNVVRTRQLSEIKIAGRGSTLYLCLNIKAYNIGLTQPRKDEEVPHHKCERLKVNCSLKCYKWELPIERPQQAYEIFTINCYVLELV